MEGVYLYSLIFFTSVSPYGPSILGYMVFGWAMPLICIIPWIVAKANYEDTGCWLTNANQAYFWILRAPITISILVSVLDLEKSSQLNLRKTNKCCPSTIAELHHICQNSARAIFKDILRHSKLANLKKRYRKQLQKVVAIYSRFDTAIWYPLYSFATSTAMG